MAIKGVLRVGRIDGRWENWVRGGENDRKLLEWHNLGKLCGDAYLKANGAGAWPLGASKDVNSLDVLQ